MTEEEISSVNLYCYQSYRDTLMVQCYLAENNIPIFYTDTISLSEVNFLLGVVKEIIERKNQAQN